MHLKVIVKWLLSHTKSTWDFEDYPIMSWKNPNARQNDIAFGAGIINWSLMVAHGEAREKAVEALRERFKLNKGLRLDLPRPGTKVPIKYASTEKIDKHRGIAEDFFRRILDQDFNEGFYSDESALWQIEGPDEEQANQMKQDIIDRTLKVYGVDISEMYDEPLFKILEYIKQNQTQA